MRKQSWVIGFIVMIGLGFNLRAQKEKRKLPKDQEYINIKNVMKESSSVASDITSKGIECELFGVHINYHWGEGHMLLGVDEIVRVSPEDWIREGKEVYMSEYLYQKCLKYQEQKNIDSSSGSNPVVRKQEVYQRGHKMSVVLDAGHGGRDPGAIGKNGIREKDLVLEITLLVARILKSKGIEVILSRKEDKYISLGNRVKVANRTQSDCFVSIHANASLSNLKGYEIYHRRQEHYGNRRRLRHLGSQEVPYQGCLIKPRLLKPVQLSKLSLDKIVWQLKWQEIEQSELRLSEIMNQEVGVYSQIQSRGIKEAGFYVISRGVIPAVLVEIGYITDIRECNQLCSHQVEVARGIAQGICRYLAEIYP